MKIKLVFSVALLFSLVCFGATGIGPTNSIQGMNPAGTSPEWKVLTNGANTTVTFGPKLITITSTGGGGTNFSAINVTNMTGLTNLVIGAGQMLKINDGAGFVNATFDPNGQLNIFYGTNYDRSGNVIFSVKPDGSTITGTTNADGSLTLTSTASGNGASTNANYLMWGTTNAGLSSGKVLTAGTGIILATNTTALTIATDGTIVTTNQLHTIVSGTNILFTTNGSAVTINTSGQYQPADAALSNVVANVIATTVLNPTDGTNFVFDFSKPSMVIKMTNHVNWLQSTGRLASATLSMFSDCTIYNESGANYTLTFPTTWNRLGSAPVTTITNGYIVHIAAMNKRGTSETNVTYGFANKQ